MGRATRRCWPSASAARSCAQACRARPPPRPCAGCRGRSRPTSPGSCCSWPGGNDFLRKVPREQSEANLRAMLALARASGVAVLLVGVPVPGLFAGPPAFYEALAEEHGVPHEGSVLRRVLYDNRTKSDPIHPNALGYRRLAEALAARLQETWAAAVYPVSKAPHSGSMQQLHPLREALRRTEHPPLEPESDTEAVQEPA